MQYSITFANNAYLYAKSSIYGSHEFTVSLDQDANRVVNVNENGNFDDAKYFYDVLFDTRRRRPTWLLPPVKTVV